MTSRRSNRNTNRSEPRRGQLSRKAKPVAARPLPLSGVLVADFSRILAGPFCTMMLGDAGARVIKIEEPRGDETRRWGPPFVDGESAYFLSINRNKESVAIDLKSEEGGEVARRLIARADVVVDNFRREQRSRFGLDRESVHRLNPRAICCSILGFEPGSAEEALPGFDLLAQASAGLMAITGEPGGSPMKIGVALSDVLTAHYAYGAIATALFARERDGLGEGIEVSLFGATVASLVNVGQSHLITGKDAARYGNEHPSLVPYRIFDGSDRPFALGIGTDRQFELLCRSVLGQPELAADRRFSTNVSRVRNRRLLHPILEEKFREGRARKWVAACRRNDIPAVEVQSIRELFKSEAGKQLLETLQHPSIGQYRTVGSPLHLSSRGIARPRPAPRLGEQTKAVIEELGLGAVPGSR
jgi:crotonobetainyl-CoA:carnitine CoA-transferase CaiB-like acyl-CoA transferase